MLIFIPVFIQPSVKLLVVHQTLVINKKVRRKDQPVIL
jgi:hypothetical protein